MLQEVGCVNVEVDDLTDEVLPLWRLVGVIGCIPYRILQLFGLQTRFTNLMAGVESYQHWGEGRYIFVRSLKPWIAQPWLQIVTRPFTYLW
jgi:hypothetical protein